LPSLPLAALPRTLELFWLARLTDTSYPRRSRFEASVRTDCPVELHRTATFFFTCIIHCIFVFSLYKCLSFSLVAVYLQLFELTMNVFVTMLFNRIDNAMCLHNTLWWFQWSPDASETHLNHHFVYTHLVYTQSITTSKLVLT